MTIDPDRWEPMDTQERRLVFESFAAYRSARLELLGRIGCASNRDPLAEFSEWLVGEIVGGKLAGSRVQKGYDVIGPDGERIQVKYLANPEGRWDNGHCVQFTEDMDYYAVVFFEHLRVTTVLIFRRESLFEVCQELKKRHPNQETILQITPANFRRLLSESEQFSRFGVRVFISGEDGWFDSPGGEARWLKGGVDGGSL